MYLQSGQYEGGLFLQVPTAKQSGFTLIELLVVISIIALLIGILMPVLGKARSAARGAQSLSNLRQVGIANMSYLMNNKDYYMAHEAWFNPDNRLSYVKDLTGVFPNGDIGGRRSHWEDHLIEYMPSPKAFLSPLLNDSELVSGFTNAFAVSPYREEGHVRGGYGYNLNYLGMARGSTNMGYHAKDGTDVIKPSDTVLVGDSAGSRKGVVDGPHSNSYGIDPPIPAYQYGSKRNKYYGDGSGVTRNGVGETPPTTGTFAWLYRVYPAPRNNGVPGFVFCDGHAAYVAAEIIDDYDGDGTLDNGYWNGKGDVDPSKI